MKLVEFCVVGSSDLCVFVTAEVKLGETCTIGSTDQCETDAMCDAYGTCSEYVEVTTL